MSKKRTTPWRGPPILAQMQGRLAAPTRGPRGTRGSNLLERPEKCILAFLIFFQLDVGLYPDEISYVCSSGSCYDQKGRFPSMFHFTLWVLLSFHLKPGRSCCLEEVLALYILFLCLRLLLWFG